MFDKLLDLVVEFIDHILPFQIIPHYDKGIRLRFGKLYGESLSPGLHWKIPFIDVVITHMVKPKTINLIEQTITTKDYKSIVVKAVIKYETYDVLKLLLEVNDAVDALADMVQGIIREKIVERNWNECNSPILISDISKKAKMEAKKWGLTILEITLTDLAEMKSFRLLNGTIVKNL